MTTFSLLELRRQGHGLLRARPNQARANFVQQQPKRNVRLRVDVQPQASETNNTHRILSWIDQQARKIRQGFSVFGAVKYFSALAVLGIVSALVMVAYQAVIDSKSYALERVEVTGLTQLEEAFVVQQAGLVNGRSIFQYQPEQIAARLRGHPWIRTANVERILPDRFRIQIEEKAPLAYVVGPHGLLVLSRDGELLPPIHTRDVLSLPIITGIEHADAHANASNNDPARYLDIQRLLAATRVLVDANALGLRGERSISQIDIKPTGEMTLMLGSLALPIHVGTSCSRAKLERLQKLLRDLDQRHVQPSYVRLDLEQRRGRVVVGLQQT